MVGCRDEDDDGGDGGDGGGGVGGSGGVKYGFTSPPGPRIFVRLLSRVPLGACDVTRNTTNTITRRTKVVVVAGGFGGEEGRGVMARLLDGAQRTKGCFVSVSLHRHTRRQCFVSVQRRDTAKIGNRERERYRERR